MNIFVKATSLHSSLAIFFHTIRDGACLVPLTTAEFLIISARIPIHFVAKRSIIFVYRLAPSFVNVFHY